MPADINCKLIISFPSEMPVTTDLVSYDSGTNLMNKASSTLTATGTVTGVGSTTTTASILGCSSYSESSLTSVVTLTKLFNIAYVKAATPFSLKLYAVSGGVDYNIAEYTTITVASTEFATGAITTFTMTAST